MEQTYIGTASLGMFAAGSKSEHLAVFLNTDNKRYKIRTVGGKPFTDDSLNKYIGKTIACTGYIEDYLLITTKIEIKE